MKNIENAFLKNILLLLLLFSEAALGPDLMKLAAAMFVVIEEMDPGCKMQTVCHESHSGRLCLTLGPKLWDQVKCLCSLQPQHITFFDFIQMNVQPLSCTTSTLL